MEQIYNTYGPMLYKALGKTIELALWSLLYGSLLGIFFGLASVIKNKFSRAIAAIYVNLIRSIPLMIFAFFVYFGIPYAYKNIFGVAYKLSVMDAGVICLSLNCGAYMAEIIRAGIQSIDPGQMEAARSLGLSYWRSMFRVVLPQAIKNMIPSIVNQFIITLKDTSIISAIGYQELTAIAKNVAANTFKSFETYAIVAIMYLVVILILQQIANALERSLKRDRK